MVRAGAGDPRRIGPRGASRERELPRFPGREVGIALALIVVHLALVLWIAGPGPPGREVLLRGGLLAGATREQPWRLLTSLFLHSDASHALWNGVSLLVFAVPLLSALGPARTGWIYLASGLGGGLTALYFAEPGTLIVGSSGAVAGLFGAWVILTLRAARIATLRTRAHVRALGLAMLVLPSLLNPGSASGRPVSVSSHLGGMLTGMMIGAILSVGMAPPRESDEDPEPTDFSSRIED